jgi:hypothetical protein
LGSIPLVFLTWSGGKAWVRGCTSLNELCFSRQTVSTMNKSFFFIRQSLEKSVWICWMGMTLLARSRLFSRHKLSASEWSQRKGSASTARGNDSFSQSLGHRRIHLFSHSPGDSWIQWLIHVTLKTFGRIWWLLSSEFAHSRSCCWSSATNSVS